MVLLCAEGLQSKEVAERGWVFTSTRSANGVVGSCRPVLKG
jgi:hypothetical protein